MSTWTSSFPPNRYGTYTAHGTDGNLYTWNNDCWSDGAGPQTISVNDNNDWGVVSSQTWNTQYWVETYPHIGWAGGKPLSQYPVLAASTRATGPALGDGLQWETAFDVWLNNGKPGADSGYEVMIWTDTSNVSPSGYVKDVTIAGTDYAFFQDQGGNGPASWFVRKNNTQTAFTDIKAVLEWLMGYRGNYLGPSDPTVDTVEFGWEVWGTGGKPVSFHCSKFLLSTTDVIPAPDPVPVPVPVPAPKPAASLAVTQKSLGYHLTVNRGISGYTGTYATKITGPSGFLLNHNSTETSFSVTAYNPGTYLVTTGAAGYANAVQVITLV